MGSIQVKQQLPDRKKFSILDYGYCKVWKRKTDQVQLMEEYQLRIESEQRLKAFENVWPLRTNNQTFVNVYYFSHVKSGSFCQEVARGSIFLERMPYRVSQFSNIIYSQILHILKRCLEGYSVLYQNFGLFYIRSTMIGFTQHFKVKMWCHTDFSEPQPQNPHCKTLQQMLISLINAVQISSQTPYMNYPKFSQFLIKTNYLYLSKDFNYLLKGLFDYVNKFNVFIPSQLMSLRDFIKKPEGWEKFKACNSYPKIIKTQSQIASQTNINQSQSGAKTQPSQKGLIKKYSSETEQRSCESTETVRKYPHFNTKNQTNYGDFLKEKKQAQENINIDTYKIVNDFSYELKKKPITSINSPRVSSRNQIDQIKYWKSAEKYQNNQTSSSNEFRMQMKATGKMGKSRQLHSPAQRALRNQLSNHYFGEKLSSLRQFSNNTLTDMKQSSSQIQGLQSSGPGYRRQKSRNSDLSLIQDLQLQERVHYNAFKA